MNSNGRIQLTAVATCPCCGTSISLEILPPTTAAQPILPATTAVGTAADGVVVGPLAVGDDFVWTLTLDPAGRR